MPIILSKQSLKAITDANIGKDNVKKFLQTVDKKNKKISLFKGTKYQK